MAPTERRDLLEYCTALAFSLNIVSPRVSSHPNATLRYRPHTFANAPHPSMNRSLVGHARGKTKELATTSRKETFID